MIRSMRFSGFTLLAFFVVAFSAFSDTRGNDLLRVKRNNLSNLISTIDYVSSEIQKAQKRLISSEGLGRETRIKAEIDELSRKLDDLNQSFDLLATGVRYETAPGNLQGPFNWNHELKMLFAPLIRELQELTLRPREIEKLRSDIDFYEAHIRLANTAVDNLNKLIKVSKNAKGLNERLEEAVKKWWHRKNEWESLNNIAVLQLELKSADQSISKSIQDIPRIFFKSHGRNMVIAFLVFLLSGFAMFRLYGLIRKYSPIHAEKRSFYGRIFDLSYVFCSGLFSVVCTLSVLYLFSDWVLLSVAIIFIFGVVWASKHAFSQLWYQIRLVLNFGPVKEGEVIVYNGLLYKVVSINLFTKIYNPLIQGGLIKIPISDLMPLRSRSLLDEEPWFPSGQGDWVILKDEQLCRILTQTPETVKVRLPGGAELSYMTGEYLSLSLMNLSSGFRLSMVFGLDYKLQPEITGKIPGIFRKGVLDDLAVFGYGEYVSDVQVYFKTAASSSLDLEIIADFKGTAGEYYYRLERFVQSACVNICNRQDWSIPFMQMTVHMAEEDQPPASPYS